MLQIRFLNIPHSRASSFKYKNPARPVEYITEESSMEGQGYFGAGLSVISFFLRYRVQTIPKPLATAGIVFGALVAIIELVIPEMRPPVSALILYLIGFLAFGGAVYFHQLRYTPVATPTSKLPTESPASHPLEKTSDAPDKTGPTFFSLGKGALVEDLKMKGVVTEGMQKNFDINGTLKGADIQDFKANSNTSGAGRVFIEEMYIGSLRAAPPPKKGVIQPSNPQTEKNSDGTVTVILPIEIDRGVTLEHLLIGIKGDGLLGFEVYKAETKIQTSRLDEKGFQVQRITAAGGEYRIKILKKKHDDQIEVAFQQGPPLPFR